jgi:microcystin-dependent protein
MSRRDYAGGAQPTKSTATFTAADTLLSCVALLGWPDAVQGPFAVSVDRDTEFEEKILCDAVNGNDLRVIQRGYDGTTARDHSAGATVEHVFTAIDADEANDHINRNTGVHGVPVGARVVGTTGQQTLTEKTLDMSPGTGNVITNLPESASPALVGLVNAEAGVRAGADATLGQAIVDEAAARTQAVSDEAAARASADQAHATAPDPHPQYLTMAEARPIGEVTMWAGAGAPAGWLVCDGQVFNAATFPALATLLGSNATPDLRDRVPRGVGPGHALKETGGADTHTLVAANLPAHAHTINHDHGTTAAHDLAGSVITASQSIDDAGTGATGATTIAAIPTHTHDVPAYNGNSGNGPGTGTAFDTTDPWFALNFIIRAL